MSLAPLTANAQPDRPTVSIAGSAVIFYPTRLVLDAHGRATLDDGVLHVAADHIMLDLTNKRYVAIGDVIVVPSDVALRESAAMLRESSPTPSATPPVNIMPSPGLTSATTATPSPSVAPAVSVTPSPTVTPSPAVMPSPSAVPSPSPMPSPNSSPASAQPATPTSTPSTSPTPTAAPEEPATTFQVARGDVFGKDLDTQRGLLVSLDVTPSRRAIVGALIKNATEGVPAGEPLALPDVGTEIPFASASRAVAHLGADVRLTNAKVVVPGSKSIPLPSYVYTYSTAPGYAVTNLGNVGEEVPVYVGSTRNTMQGVHFYYRSDLFVALGFDDRIVNGSKDYLLGSIAPVFGRSKSLNFLWQEQINSHTQQSLTSDTFEGFGTTYSYDVRDAIHHSYLELNGNAFPLQAWNGTFAWQGYDQVIAHEGILSHLFFHLRSEYGVLHTPPEFGFLPFPSNILLPQLIQHVAGEAYLATQPLTLGPATTVYASADDRFSHDTLPHLQSVQTYTLTLSQRANRFITLGGSITDSPIHDGYPTLNSGFATHLDTETATFSYDHGRNFSLLLSGTHETASTQSPSGLIVTPWIVSADTRFRVSQTLALELGRSYFFGFEGQRFGTITFQILP